MTADGVLLLVGSVFGAAITVGSTVWGLAKDKTIGMYKSNAEHALRDQQEWKLKAEKADADLKKAWDEQRHDSLELERLRAETNFAPIEKRLNDFIESQTKINFELLERLKEFAKNQQEQAMMFRVCMEKLVPALAKEVIEEQDKELHQS